MKTKYRGGITLEIPKNAPYYHAYFRGADGRMRHKSTRVPHAGGFYQGEKLTAKQAKIRAAVVAQQLADAECKKNCQIVTLEEAIRVHVAKKAKRVSTSRRRRIEARLSAFSSYLPNKGGTKLEEISKSDIEKFAEKAWGGLRHNSFRYNYNILRGFFAACVEGDLLRASPCPKISTTDKARSDKITRDIFTQQELDVILREAPEPIASAVKICLGTYGQRLGDVIKLKWCNIDFEARTAKIITSKTGALLVLPLQDWFLSWLRARAATAKTDTVLGCACSQSSLSTRFGEVLLKLGLAKRVGGEGAQLGHNTKSFHCLRATVVTMLHAAGVPEGMAMRLVGHSSRLVHEIYLRPSTRQLAAAAEKLPSFG